MKIMPHDMWWHWFSKSDAAHSAQLCQHHKALFQSLQREQLSLKDLGTFSVPIPGESSDMNDQVPAASHLFKECYHNPYHQLFSMCSWRCKKNCDNSGSCHDLRFLVICDVQGRLHIPVGPSAWLCAGIAYCNFLLHRHWLFSAVSGHR